LMENDQVCILRDSQGFMSVTQLYLKATVIEQPSFHGCNIGMRTKGQYADFLSGVNDVHIHSFDVIVKLLFIFMSLHNRPVFCHPRFICFDFKSQTSELISSQFHPLTGYSLPVASSLMFQRHIYLRAVDFLSPDFSLD